MANNFFFKAADRYQDGKKIMAKESKTPQEYTRAIELFSEAISMI